MSGVFRTIGKVFSKVWDFVRPIVEVVAIAAAVYFTAGVALSAFPATSAFAAALPGFASSGGVAGEGVFSSLADSIGMGGGLQAGATADVAADAAAGSAAGGAVAAGADLPTAAVAGDASATSGAIGGAATGAGGAIDVAPAGSALSYDAAGNILGSVPAGGSSVAGAASGALTNKLLLASVGANLISGLTAPSPTDIAAAKAGFYGSYYGMDSNGSSAPAPNLSVGPQSEPGNTSGMGGFAQQQLPGVNVPAVGLSTPAPGVPGFQGTQKSSLIPVVAPGAMPPQGQGTSNAVQGATAAAQPKLIPTGSGAPSIIPATTTPT